MKINDVTCSEPHRARIVEALRRMGPSRIAEIAGAAGMSNGAAFRYCYGMYEKGILSRIVKGNGPVRYCLADGWEAPAPTSGPPPSSGSDHRRGNRPLLTGNPKADILRDILTG